MPKNSNQTSNKHLMRAVIALLIGASMAFFYWLSQAAPTTTQQPHVNAIPASPQATQQLTNNNTTATKTVHTPTQASAKPKFVTGIENLPRSLQGTDVDGEIIIDENKQLVVTNGLRRLFDYFLTTQGEETTEDIIARIEAYISYRVPEPAKSQAIKIFRDYMAYLKATATIQEAGGKPASQIDMNAVIAQKKALSTLQKQYFDDKTITAFFGAEKTYDDYNIKLLKIARDQSLSEEQKVAARAAAVEAISDPQMKQQIKIQQNFRTLTKETKRLKQEGASKEALHQMRTKLVGTEAADRLALLDDERAVWESKITDYLKQRKTILATAETQNTKDLQINELRHRMFTEQEQKRLTAYEELGKAQLD